MPQPAWYLDEPAIEPCERIYLEAFVDLQTCRSVGMDVGPIPWRDVADYGDRLGLVGPMHRLFCKVIRSMDEAWLRKRAADRAAEMPPPEPAPAQVE